VSGVIVSLRILAGLAGAAVVVLTALSAVRSFVVPRAAPVAITRVVFVTSRWAFWQVAKRQGGYAGRDRTMSLYAPMTLLILPAVWLTFVAFGYAAMFWAVQGGTLRAALEVSGSSLVTLGFAHPTNLAGTALSVSEAAFGIGLVGLLITYLPTIYAAFVRRETAVALLDVRAGSPPSATEMIWRYHAIHGLARLDEVWESWEIWFADIEESHTSLGALPHFRSPQSHRSWITAAGAILDAAAIRVAVLDLPPAPNAQLCIRSGWLALRRISDFFGIVYDPAPRPDDPISVSRIEFDGACARFTEAGIALKPDRDQAWADFSGWRVNYDTVLLALAGLTMAPPAPWSGDRATPYRRPPVARRRGRLKRRRKAGAGNGS